VSWSCIRLALLPSSAVFSSLVTLILDQRLTFSSFSPSCLPLNFSCLSWIRFHRGSSSLVFGFLSWGWVWTPWDEVPWGDVPRGWARLRSMFFALSSLFTITKSAISASSLLSLSRVWSLRIAFIRIVSLLTSVKFCSISVESLLCPSLQILVIRQTMGGLM
jgi:hypothetical protein